MRWVLRPHQFALFEAWYRWAAAEGGAWFEMDLLGGLGLLPQEARFTRQFDARPWRGRLWEVTSELEIRARPTLSEGAMTLLLTEDMAGSQREHRCAARLRPQDPARTPRLVAVLPASGAVQRTSVRAQRTSDNPQSTGVDP